MKTIAGALLFLVFLAGADISAAADKGALILVQTRQIPWAKRAYKIEVPEEAVVAGCPVSMGDKVELLLKVRKDFDGPSAGKRIPLMQSVEVFGVMQRGDEASGLFREGVAAADVSQIILIVTPEQYTILDIAGAFEFGTLVVCSRGQLRESKPCEYRQWQPFRRCRRTRRRASH